MPNKHPLSLYLDDSVRDAVARIASADHRSVSGLISHVLSGYVQDHASQPVHADTKEQPV